MLDMLRVTVLDVGTMHRFSVVLCIFASRSMYVHHFPVL